MATRVAFVLSGGGSHGAVQVGMLQALYERGIAPDTIVGTSVGAVNGAFIAGRPPTPSTATELARIWRGLKRSDVFPVQPLSGLRRLLGRNPALLSADALRDLIDRTTTFDRIEDATIPFHVIATDLLTGLEVCLSRGDLIEAVLASAAIPGIFPPQRVGGQTLVDGGVSNNTPISHCVGLGADTIYVLPTGNACALRQPPRTAMGIAMHSMTLLVMQRLILEIQYYQESARLIVLPPPCPLNVQPIDFSASDRLVRVSREDSHRYLDDLEAGRAEAPISMHMHGHRHKT